MSKLTWPIDQLTRFEVARLVGARSLQISLGAPVLIQTDINDPIEIAKLEFKNNIIPITIKRKMPNEEEVVVDVKKGIVNWMELHAGEI